MIIQCKMINKNYETSSIGLLNSQNEEGNPTGLNKLPNPCTKNAWNNRPTQWAKNSGQSDNKWASLKSTQKSL